MAEGESKEASSALGVIPNAYFDLIARVIPGCLFLFALTLATSANIVAKIFSVFVPYDGLHDSTTAWVLLIVSVGYVLGHAFSPMVRFLEEGPPWVEVIRAKIGEHERKEEEERKDSSTNPGFWGHLRYFYLPPFWSSSAASKPSRGKLHEDYNKLRIQNPSAATMAIRIRAEYTMYAGFAVGITIALLVGLTYRLQALARGNIHSLVEGITLDQWLVLSAGVIAVPVMLYRHLHTWDRFRKTVTHFLEANKSAVAARQAASGSV